MAVHTVVRSVLSGLRRVHFPQKPTACGKDSLTMYAHVTQDCTLAPSLYNNVLSTCSKIVNYQHLYSPHKVNLLWMPVKNTIYMQVKGSYKEIGSKIFYNLRSSCRNTRKGTYNKIVNVLQRISRFKGWVCQRTRLKQISLGSMFFVSPQLFSKRKEEKIIAVELPKERKRKKRGKLFELLLSMYEILHICLRALRLVLTFAPILALYPVTYFGKTATDVWWRLMLRAIELSGPILIKLGQWASTRRDLFPDSCCSQFSRLQRRVKPHSWKHTVNQMRRAFGPNWRKIFIKFDNDCKPIGSGCAAQVYKVWMSSEAIPDHEILEEILAEMDDDSPSIDEGGERQHEGETEVNKEVSVLSIVEDLASDVLNSEEQTPEPKVLNDGKSMEPAETTYSLVEEWQESGLDKSLPVEEAPPDDLDGLVPVAIKVLHPGVQEACRRDLWLMKTCAWFITLIFPPIKWLSLPQCVDEFAEVMEAQINLSIEAENLEKFSENFAGVPFIKFPRPLRPYVTRKVLVETYEDGEPMINIIRSTEEETSEELKKRLAEIGVDALLKMVFVDNLVHGDLHPGNMLVQHNDTGQEGANLNTGDTMRIIMVDVGCDTFVMDVQPDPNPLRICLLDCGIVSKLSEQNLANIKAVFKQVVLGDGESVADLFLNNSEHQCHDPDAFKTEITELVQTARENTISLGQVDVGMLLQQVLSILLRHRVRLESAFSAVVLAIFVLEGLGRTLDPNMDILERARPILVTGEVYR
ncbi:uncharacterized aarF domain-containing protein kinase 2 isoform X2 [Procambarus clarkii]|uniref:uncharacterized aarF domain-containing protein kinase 2 isoform X2 n=1 Tax=Procambarus clarkii TaxID=6728 RepID=UPI001E676EC4|nr:uncharacterized aarF domain-containing protein kinase 2-like isoform X2 [Procambarus clarkii]